MNVFVDTSALFAMLVKNDYMHVRARATFEALSVQNTEFHITSYVLLEILALLQTRVRLDAARLFHHEFLPILKVHWVNEQLHEKAFRRLELRGKREISLVDCTGFIWMEENNVSYVLTYDRYYADEGFTILGHPDDLKTL